jgi:hypothetical protein
MKKEVAFVNICQVYAKYGGYIWPEHVVDDIYGIKRDEDGHPVTKR